MSIHLVEPALDITEPGVWLAPLGSAGLLRRVGREVEPGQAHAATQERPSLNLRNYRYVDISVYVDFIDKLS